MLDHGVRCLFVPSSCWCVLSYHVTELYATSSSDCKNTANHPKSIKELVHYNILAADNSVSGGETLERKDDGKPTTIVCDWGEKAVLTVFKVIILATIAVFLVYVACAVFGHFKAVYLKRKEATLLKRQKAEQMVGEKLILEIK